MSDGAIDLVWGGGLRNFRFAIGEFRALQDAVNRRRIAIGAPIVGPMDLLKSLRANNAWPDDIRDVLRLGLIGGGMKPPEAHGEMVHYFDNSPPLEHMKPAMMVLLAGLAGAPGEDVAKKKGGAETTASAEPVTSTDPSISA